MHPALTVLSLILLIADAVDVAAEVAAAAFDNMPLRGLPVSRLIFRGSCAGHSCFD